MEGLPPTVENILPFLFPNWNVRNPISTQAKRREFQLLIWLAEFQHWILFIPPGSSSPFTLHLHQEGDLNIPEFPNPLASSGGWPMGILSSELMRGKKVIISTPLASSLWIPWPKIIGQGDLLHMTFSFWVLVTTLSPYSV